MTEKTGSPMGRPLKPFETKTNLDFIPPEPFFALTPLGKKLWVKIWVEKNLYLDQDKDFILIQLICEAWQDIRRMKALLKKDGDLLWINGNTNLVLHPYVKQVNELQTKMTGWLSKLGFSPADRAKINTDIEETADDAISYLTSLVEKKKAASIKVIIKAEEVEEND